MNEAAIKALIAQKHAVRRVIYAREKECCFYCDTWLMYENSTIDHIKPKSLGGELSVENSVLACVECNSERGDLPANIYLVLKMTGGLK